MEKIRYIAQLEKQSSEKRPFTVTYTDRMPSGATLSSCTVAAYNLVSGTLASSVVSSMTATIDGDTASVFLQAGTDSVRYKITFTATLSDGSIFEDDVLMAVKDL
jgi:hypothetical protein